MTPIVGGVLGVALGVAGGVGLSWTVRRYVRPGVPGRNMRYAVATLARWAALALGLAALLKHGGGQKVWILGGFGVGYMAAVGAGMRRRGDLARSPMKEDNVGGT